MGLLLLLAGCGLFGPEVERIERTYPPASDHPTIRLVELFAPDTEPGLYNVEVYATRIVGCPAELECETPDEVVFVGHLYPDPPQQGLHLSVSEPRQFRERALYRLSLQVDTADDPETAWVERTIQLIGYSRLT